MSFTKTKGGRTIEVNVSNPRIQCVQCGKWKRLHGVDREGRAFQRFYGGCSTRSTETVSRPHLTPAMEKLQGDDWNDDVCDDCCKKHCIPA